MAELILYHSPNTRSTGTRILLAELGAPYELRAVNMKAGEHRSPAFMAVNPLGKVPAIVHDGALITEQPAIYLYLADLFPKAGLAPAIGDPQRGPYLRWLVYYGSCFEPAVVDRAMKREPAPQGISPYGTFEEMLEVLAAALRRGPWLLGDRFSAADLLWGTALRWMRIFELVPALPEIERYVAAVCGRPSFAAVAEQEAALAAAHEAAATAGA